MHVNVDKLVAALKFGNSIGKLKVQIDDQVYTNIINVELLPDNTILIVVES